MTAPMRRLGALAEVALGRQRSPEHESGPYMVPYLRAANVKDGYLDLTDVKEMNFSPREQAVFGLLPGDVLVTEGAGSLAAVGAAAVWYGDLPGVICFQNTLLRLRPRPGVDGRYLAWWARHAYADRRFAAEATGVNIYHLSAERVRAVPVPVLSLADQRAIADFLEEQSVRIDQLCALRERMAQLLKERFAHQMFKWLDDVGPLVPLKSVVRFKEGPGIMAADFRDVGTPLLRIRNLVDNRVRLDGCTYVDPAEVLRRWPQFRVRLGDYIISASASVGAVALVDEPDVEGAIPYTGLIILRPQTSDVDMVYLAHFLRSHHFTRQIVALQTGVGLQHFGPTHLAQIRVPLPRREVQTNISRLADAAGAHLSLMTSALQHQVELLRERRQALITAAVTGQLDLAREIAEDAS